MNARASCVRAFRSTRRVPVVNRVATNLVRALPIGRNSQFFVDHLPRLGPVSAALPNGKTLRLIGEPSEAIANLVFWQGWSAPDPETADVFWNLAERARVVVDVGAHVGYFSLLAAHANPSSHVIAYEALPHIADRLERHLTLNLVGNVDLVRKAVGSEIGTATFWFTSAIPVPSSSGLAADFVQRNDEVTSIQVSVTTLDAEMRRLVGPVDLLKIDTETTEPDVLAGARHLIARDRPTVVCEVLPEPGIAERLDEWLTQLRYRASLLTPRGPLAAKHIQPDDRWRNWLLQPY